MAFQNDCFQQLGSVNTYYISLSRQQNFVEHFFAQKCLRLRILSLITNFHPNNLTS